MDKVNSYQKGRGAQLNPNNKFSRLLYTEEDEYKEYCFKSNELLKIPSTEFIRVYPKTIVNQVNSPDVPFSYSMNPYQGCEHGCIYCYARVTHEFWGYSAGQDFEQKVLVKENAPELLEKKLQSKSWKVAPIMLSGNTDCYQPVERKLGITRKLLEVAWKHRQPIGIITKNALITRDLDILTDMARLNLVHVAISLTSLNEELRSLLEPRTSSAIQKLRAIEQLSSAGVPVNVMMAPLIPHLNSEEIFDMAKAVSAHGAMNLSYTTIRVNGIIGLLFEDWLHKNFPDRAEKVLNQIKSMHGGKLSDSRFGKRMSGEGIFALQLKNMITIARKRHGLKSEIKPLNTALFIRNPSDQMTLF